MKTTAILRRGLAAAAVLVIATSGLAACGNDNGPSNPRTVTVVGSGEVKGTPDTLSADIGVEVTGNDVTSALNGANEKVKAVTDALVNAGVDRKDIQTQQVSINPQYSSPAPGGVSQISSYVATNSLRVTVRDLSKASTVLSAAATAGGDDTRISNVGFSIDDNTKLMNQARESAFNDARSRAEQYASLAGDSLGLVISVDESTTTDQSSPGPMMRSTMSASPVPIEAGQQSVTLTVKVTYALD